MESLLTLAASHPSRTFVAGEILIGQGYQGGDLFILESGQLAVERDGVRIATIATPGSLIGEMSTCLAHEVRNPMTTVRGLAQLIAGENPAQAETFQLMVEEVDRANRLIGDFLMLSRNYISSRETGQGHHRLSS